MHLTLDHAFELANFLGLNAVERDYFVLLVERDRAGNPAYRHHLDEKISALKKQNDSIAKRTDRNPLIMNTPGLEYFASWMWSAIHFLTAIPEYRTAKRIAERLGLKETLVESILLHLNNLTLVENRADGWFYKRGEFHLDRQSQQVLMHHQNWRQRAVVDANDYTNDSLHFTSVQTLSQADFLRIRELLLDMIARVNRTADPSAPEECMVLTLDLFRA